MAEHYLESHEWARQEGGEVVVGLSSYAAGEIGDVIHVEMPAAGQAVTRGEPCGEIESVKAVNDFYSPVDGAVVAVNEGLEERPELVNDDPLGAGWLIRVKAAGDAPLDGLLSAADYEAHVRA
jgi:glycine cleavage system H protein